MAPINYTNPIPYNGYADEVETSTTPDPLDQKHKAQMDAFMYTCSILFFYALLILYFMIRQLCHQEREFYEQIYNGKDTKDVRLQFLDENDRIFRSNIKKQLCVHLIKLGQLQQHITESVLERHFYNKLDQLANINAASNSSGQSVDGEGTTTGDPSRSSVFFPNANPGLGSSTTQTTTVLISGQGSSANQNAQQSTALAMESENPGEAAAAMRSAVRQMRRKHRVGLCHPPEFGSVLERRKEEEEAAKEESRQSEAVNASKSKPVVTAIKSQPQKSITFKSTAEKPVDKSVVAKPRPSTTSLFYRSFVNFNYSSPAPHKSSSWLSNIEEEDEDDLEIMV